MERTAKGEGFAMLQLTLESGQVVQRVFAGYITTEDDLDKFVAEMRKEVADNRTGHPILCEVWEYVRMKGGGRLSRSKRVLAS